MTQRHRASSVENQTGFYEQKIHSWKELYDAVFELNQMASHGWIYRGQTRDWTLQTTIERALVDWGIELKRATEGEFQTIREFRRRILDPIYKRVSKILCSAFHSCSIMALPRGFWIVVILHSLQ